AALYSSGAGAPRRSGDVGVSCYCHGAHPDLHSFPTRRSSDLPTSWSQDGHGLFVYQTGEVPAKVYRVDLAAGKRVLWKQLVPGRSEEHTSELQSRVDLVCRLLLEKKKKTKRNTTQTQAASADR